MGARGLSSTTGGIIMSTQAETLQRTLATLFPQLTDQARAQLAREVVRLVNRSTEEGWDLAAVTLLTRGANRTPIGTTLKNLRVRAGLTQDEVTRQTPKLTRSNPWHSSKVTRIESGRVPISFGDLQFLLQLYGVQNQDTVEALWHLAQESHQPRRPVRRAS